MVEKVDVYSDKSNGSKIYAFDYLRVIALVMILYDHLGGFYNPNWIVKKIIDFFFAVPLDIIQDFGAFGVSLFFLPPVDVVSKIASNPLLNYFFCLVVFCLHITEIIKMKQKRLLKRQ